VPITADEGNDVARRRRNRAFRVAAGLLGATALAVTAVAAAPSPVAIPASAQSAVGSAVRPAFAAAQTQVAAAQTQVAAAQTQVAAAQTRVAAAQMPVVTARTRVVAGRPIAKGASCSRTLNVVAHEDDDLLFINPSVSDDIAAGRCVVTVFVTAGDSGRPPSYWLRREQGSMAAYAAMSGASASWASDTVVLAGHPIVRQRLLGTRITLLFMRLPDAHGSAARPFGSLQALWQGAVPSLRPLGSGGAYTRQALVKTLTAAMAAYQPDRIRTLDYAGHYGDGDHADHHTVGYFAFAAQRYYHAHHRISGYRGYTVAAYPDNLDESVAGRKLDYFLAYAPYDSKVCQSADVCLTNFYGPRFTHSLTTASSVH
jgi:LmbE family N-acetylglucosaminyl deacetylase